MLKGFDGAAVAPLIVWERVISTDFSAPDNRALARISDRRAVQFWDPGLAVSKSASPVLRADRAPVVGKESLVTGDVVWDFAAVYPAQSRWNEHFPVPVFKGAPVVQVADALRA